MAQDLVRHASTTVARPLPHTRALPIAPGSAPRTLFARARDLPNDEGGQDGSRGG